eukprot:TRINITY_DN2576_c0_g4_i1.p3 TRINITY_DN2576_c0_g4~~TRINITY_DN2576_c0_g4_i1.p3  ORF type:complete len:103 (+),score=8.92 TRINITY_DN2576_c0_g4_i1:510-818(+)
MCFFLTIIYVFFSLSQQYYIILHSLLLENRMQKLVFWWDNFLIGCGLIYLNKQIKQIKTSGFFFEFKKGFHGMIIFFNFMCKLILSGLIRSFGRSVFLEYVR